MNGSTELVARYRAFFTKVLIIVGIVGCLSISASILFGLYIIESDKSLSLSIVVFLTVSAVVFCYLAKYVCTPQNYKISAYIGIFISVTAVTLMIYQEKVPVNSGSFFYMSPVLLITTYLCSIKAGLIVLFYFFIIIIHTAYLPSSNLDLIGMSYKIHFDRIWACICVYAAAFLSEYTTTIILAQLEEQGREIQLKEKLSSLGVFVGGIAHEINNPLMIMTGAFNFIKQYISSTPQGNTMTKWIDIIDRSSDRISHIIQSLLFFTHEGKQSKKNNHFSTKMPIDDALHLLENRLKDTTIRIEKNLNSTINIEGNFLHLSSVVRIVVENAIDSLLNSQVKDPQISIIDYIKHDSYYIEIRDNGDGIPAAIQAKVLDPFFTTKSVGNGSGMGLALAHSICRALNWDLSFTSVSHDTRFYIIIKIPSS